MVTKKVATKTIQKPLRDAHGHFISKNPKNAKKKGTSIHSKPLPKPVKEIHKKLLDDITEYKDNHPVTEKGKTKHTVNRVVNNVKDMEYTVYHDHSTNKDITVGKLKQPSTAQKKPESKHLGAVDAIVTVMKHLSEKPKETVVELPQLWRYTKDGVDMFRISAVKPIDSDSCVPVFKFYDLKRDVLALKRAIAVYENSQ